MFKREINQRLNRQFTQVETKLPDPTFKPCYEAVHFLSRRLPPCHAAISLTTGMAAASVPLCQLECDSYQGNVQTEMVQQTRSFASRIWGIRDVTVQQSRMDGRERIEVRFRVMISMDMMLRLFHVALGAHL